MTIPFRVVRMSSSAWLSYLSMAFLILATIFIVIGYATPWWYWYDPSGDNKVTTYYGLWTVRTVVPKNIYDERAFRECVAV